MEQNIIIEDQNKFQSVLQQCLTLKHYQTELKVLFILGTLITIALEVYIFVVLRSRINVMFPIFMICLIIILSTYKIIYHKYSSYYKEHVIKKVLEMYYPGYNYNGDNGLAREDYEYAHFERFDRYQSEDLLSGTLDNQEFSMADVHTEIEEEDSDGDTSYVTVFKGSVTKVELKKDTEFYLSLLNKKRNNIYNKNEVISTGNPDIDDYYITVSDNEVNALRRLTPDITNRLMDLQNKLGLVVEMKLIHQQVYFRFRINNMFEPVLFNANKQLYQVYYYMVLLDDMKEIILNLLKNIDSKFES